MLTLKQTRKPAKGKSLKPEHFDLYLNGGVTGGKQVSSKLLLQMLSSGCINGQENAARFMEKAEKVSEIDKQRYVLPLDKTILEEFSIKTKEGALSLTDDFIVKESYLPNDDNAPQRIHDIVSEFCTGINQYYDDKINQANEEQEYTSEYSMYWTVRETNNEWQLIALHNDDTETIETRPMLNKQHVIQTLFVYCYQLPQKRQTSSEKLMNIITTVKQGMLKGLRIGFKENRIVPLNINQFNEEIQQTINEIINYFQVE